MSGKHSGVKVYDPTKAKPELNCSDQESTDPQDTEIKKSKIITVVEGAAGSGKSFYITRLLEKDRGSERGFIKSAYATISKSRFDFSSEAPGNSLISDTQKIIQALTHPSPQVFVDRLYLSQLVYQRIRDFGRSCLDQPFMKPEVRVALVGLDSFIKTIANQLSVRGMPGLSNVQVQLIIIAPTWKVLQERRASSVDKAYLFDQLDWFLYDSIATIIENNYPSLEIPVTVLRS